MTAPITVTFLRDTGHGGAAGQPLRTATSLASFIAAATQSIELAIYDFRLSEPYAGLVVGALTAAAQRGVTVRIGFDAGKPANADAATFAKIQADPAPPGTAEFVRTHFAGTQVATKAISGGSQLMHSKYVVRDAATVAATVWTGSANFTDDAWTLQENNIVKVRSKVVAAAFRTDFDEMWTAGTISGAGLHLGGSVTLPGIGIAWDFCPGDGASIDAAIVSAVSAAQHRVVVAAMVLTSRTVLAAIVAAIGRGAAVSGIYDAGQMDPIVRQWKKSKAAGTAQALRDFQHIAALLAEKHSIPYTPTSPHDFLHHKVIVADDTVITGSYNFSANAQRNAENHLRLTSATLAGRYASQIATLVDTYAST